VKTSENNYNNSKQGNVSFLSQHV